MPLVEASLKDFVGELASNAPAPGGGSVSALAGALAGALCVMVTNLTLGKERYRDVWEDMEWVGRKANELCVRLLGLVDKDTEAYDQVLTALRLPKDDDTRKTIRQQALQEATKRAALVPMQTLQSVAKVVDLVGKVVEKGNPNCITDAGVAARLAHAAAMGAAYNIRINLLGISDKDFSTRLEKEMDGLIEEITKAVENSVELVEKRLQRPFSD
jgi:glutamate formiminotransferase/formiminotetrahydrofolate cyclodeaminase